MGLLLWLSKLAASLAAFSCAERSISSDDTATNFASVGTATQRFPDPDEIRFFVYSGSAYKIPEACYDSSFDSSSYLEVQRGFLTQLYVHPWRVRDPAEADLFVIPFDMERSYACKNATGTRHMTRVNKMLDTLLDSPWYNRMGGRDHFWAVLDWRFRARSKKDGFSAATHFYPPKRRRVVKQMVIGRYMAFTSRDQSSLRPADEVAALALVEANVTSTAALALAEANVTLTAAGAAASPGEPAEVSKAPKNISRDFRWLKASRDQDWRCPIIMPIATPEGLLVTESFEQWKQRPIFAYFRGKDRNCFNERNQQLRNMTQQLQEVLPFSIFSNDHAESHEAYVTEVTNSQFCLVFGCDDPQTSRFMEAVAAGCIPVLIDDAFRLVVAPFNRMLNYDSFTITIPESVWLHDTVAASRVIYGWHDGILRRLHAGLVAAQDDLLWRHPQSNVADLTLRSIRRECMHWQLPMRVYADAGADSPLEVAGAAGTAALDHMPYHHGA